MRKSPRSRRTKLAFEKCHLLVSGPVWVFSRPTRRHISEEDILLSHCCENLKSYILRSQCCENLNMTFFIHNCCENLKSDIRHSHCCEELKSFEVSLICKCELSCTGPRWTLCKYFCNPILFAICASTFIKLREISTMSRRRLFSSTLL
jgi:hypothetical protein